MIAKWFSGWMVLSISYLNPLPLKLKSWKNVRVVRKEIVEGLDLGVDLFQKDTDQHQVLLVT